MQIFPKSGPVIVESLRGRDLLSLADLTPDEFSGLLDSALTLKQGWKTGDRPRLLEHKTLAMIFEKQSLRTRSTFDIAMYQLGGHSVLLSQNYIGWGVRETIKDVAYNLERWTEGIMARTYGHETLVELAEHADVPVINGLSDLLHPCQLAADYLTRPRAPSPSRPAPASRSRRAARGPGSPPCNCTLAQQLTRPPAARPGETR